VTPVDASPDMNARLTCGRPVGVAAHDTELPSAASCRTPWPDGCEVRRDVDVHQAETPTCEETRARATPR